MKLTDSNKAHLTGAIIAVIFAVMLSIAAIGTVKVSKVYFGKIYSVSGYGEIAEVLEKHNKELEEGK